MPAKRAATRGQTPSKKAKTETPKKASEGSDEGQVPSSPTRKSARNWQPTASQLESIAIASEMGSKKTKKTFAKVAAQKAAKTGTGSSAAKASGRKPPTDRSSAPVTPKKGSDKGSVKGSSKKTPTKKGSAKGSSKKSPTKVQEAKETVEEGTVEKEEEKKVSKKKGKAPPKKQTGKAAAAQAEEKKDTSVQPPSKMEPLHPDLLPKLAEYRKKRAFNAKKWIQDKCKMFNDYMAECKLKACMVSLSGGVDSAVTLGLMHEASKMPGSPIEKVVAVAQPIKSSAWALNRAKECADAWGVEMYTVDQTKLHSELQKLVDDAIGIEGQGFATGQLRSYMRTPVGYYVAQLLSQSGTPCVVMGTGNMDEDGYLAYFCKAGDGVVDIQLIADIHKSEVFAVGKALGVPSSILDAAPSADLWEGHTDEEELGFTYDFVELFTGHYLKLSPAEQKKFVASLSKGAKEQWVKWSEACIKVHNRNKHKIGGPKNLNIL